MREAISFAANGVCTRDIIMCNVHERNVRNVHIVTHTMITSLRRSLPLSSLTALMA